MLWFYCENKQCFGFKKAVWSLYIPLLSLWKGRTAAADPSWIYWVSTIDREGTVNQGLLWEWENCGIPPQEGKRHKRWRGVGDARKGTEVQLFLWLWQNLSQWIPCDDICSSHSASGLGYTNASTCQTKILTFDLVRPLHLYCCTPVFICSCQS